MTAKQLSAVPSSEARPAVRFDHESVWLIPRQMMKVFGTSTGNESLNFKKRLCDKRTGGIANAEDSSAVRLAS